VDGAHGLEPGFSIDESQQRNFIGALEGAMSAYRRRSVLLRRSQRAGLAGLAFLGLCSSVSAADKPPLAPDTAVPLATQSHVSATVEFGLPALAAEIEKDIPRRLATIDERVNCVHRRVLFFRVNANCDVWGFVERSGPISLSGRGDHIYGSAPIYGVVEGQGANRFTARIHGDTKARADVEIESRPELNRDWSIDLHFSDGFRWSEAPVLHVLGLNIPIARYAEPRIRAQLAKVRERALVAARRLDLRDKAEKAWRQTFQPVQLLDSPEIWLQLTPQSVAFAGVRANTKTLSGSLEISGSAETSVGRRPPDVTPTSLPALASEVAAPGSFDVILPVHISYDLFRDKIAETLKADNSIREVQVYPSSGKLVVGLRIPQASDAGANGGQWVYLSGALETDDNGHVARLANLAGVAGNDPAVASILDPLLGQLREKISFDYATEYQNLLEAANKKLNRPLKDGFRVEGHLSSVKLDKIYLPADGVVIALRASGELRILYGL
jgi:Domain of unknown function (DUF4403)